MKESYDEGVANHIGPESCAFAREGRGESQGRTEIGSRGRTEITI
jgi:hypothetical protein